MDYKSRAFLIILSIGLLAFVLNLVRKKKLRENYAILWILTAVVFVVAPLAIDYLDEIAYSIGIYYPPALIYLLAILFLLILILRFSVTVSELFEQNKNLVQDVGIMDKKLKDLTSRLQNKKKSEC